MKVREVLGHIDCPTCGTKAGMRITHDKNGHPFGYCESNCDQQIRIGGKAHRVAAFLARYPWAAGKAAAAPPAPTVTAPAAPAAKPPKAAPVPAPAKPAAPAPFDPFGFLKK